MEHIEEINENPYEKANQLAIEDLEKIIKLAADKFFNTSKPIMTDATYDILIDFLKLKNPKSKVLKEIGAKVKGKNKVKLDYWLGSMDKIKPHNTKELEKWMQKYKSPYYISDKLDGISALVIYRPNGTINMYTRGTSDEGTDITPLIKYLNLPKYNKEIALRGELVISKKTFDKNWASTLKNARNAASGLVNSKTINPTLANDTDFVVYEIINPIKTFEEQMKLAENIGFNIVNYKLFKDLDFDVLSNYLKLRRNKSKYNIDGIIVTNNMIHPRNTKGNPEYSFAFKDILEDQRAITKVINIEWNKSKDGYIKPTLIIEPVNISGVEINRVTGHNARNMVDNNIGIGAEIEIIRSGDVIPHIQSVIKPSKVVLPEGDWHWNETNIDIIADDLKSNDILIKNIHYFFAKLDTKGLGEKIVEKLVNAGYDNIKKILLLTVDNLLEIDGFKQKSSENLINSLKKLVSNINLIKLMSASNKLGHGIGEERIKTIFEKYPNFFTEVNNWSKQEIINNLKEINGWEEKTSLLFATNYKDFIKFYNSIKDIITIEKISEKKIVKSKYTNKNIVLSGFRDPELQAKLESMGAKITNTVTKNTDFLIVKDESVLAEETGKVKKAKELGVAIIVNSNLLF